MTRMLLQVDGVSPTEKELLRSEALRLYGKPNASLLVRQLIADFLNKAQTPGCSFKSELNEATDRVELRLPRSVVEELDKCADARFSKRNYYINSLILSHLGQPQLQGDEIEVLRKSNYELAKIGNNLNQVAKAFNILVAMGGSGKPPEIGKKMASLRKEITAHTNKVLRVLDAGSSLWELKQGRGQPRIRRASGGQR